MDKKKKGLEATTIGRIGRDWRTVEGVHNSLGILLIKGKWNAGYRMMREHWSK